MPNFFELISVFREPIPADLQWNPTGHMLLWSALQATPSGAFLKRFYPPDFVNSLTDLIIFVPGLFIHYLRILIRGHGGAGAYHGWL